MNRNDNKKIEVIFCDDTKMPRKIEVPPLSAEEKKKREQLFRRLDRKYGAA